MVPALSHKVSRVSWYSGYRHVTTHFAYGIFTLFDWSFQDRSITLAKSRLQSEPQSARTLVWALSVSLAATSKITVVFSSSGYLDVSVHRVSLRMPMDSAYGDTGLPCRVSPFRHPWISEYVLLPMAFRS